MKKMISLLICICLTGGVVAYAEPTSIVTANEYELWTQSPGITCGLTDDDMLIYKCLDQGVLELYPLNKVGTGYYLAICPDKMKDGGYNGKSRTTDFTFYTIYATENGFIILSKACPNSEYYWDYGYCFADISGKVDKAYYAKNNSDVPYYILNPKGKYTNSNYTEYDDYFIITDNGKIYKMLECSEYGDEGIPYIKDRIFYRGQYRYRQNRNNYPYYYMPGGNSVKASNSTPVYFRNGLLEYGTAVRVPVSDMNITNGYEMYDEGFGSNVTTPDYKKIPNSNDLYFTIGYVQTYDKTDSRYYYYQQVDIYKADGNYMNYMKSVSIPTKTTYASSSINCVSLDDLDTNYYTSNGWKVPAVLIESKAIILNDGSVVMLNLNSSIYNSYYYFGGYNNHLAIVRSCNGNSYIYEKDASDNQYYYWQAINEIGFDNSGQIVLSDDIKLKIQGSAAPGQNGYFSSIRDWQASSFKTSTPATVKSWWGKNRCLTNTFPDGRYVTATWAGMGGGLAELWYNVYNKDGTLRATGPTGYSAQFGSSFDRYELLAFAVNNSKFVVCLADIGKSFLEEYYRVAVVQESDTGEITSKVQLGEKNITPPDTSDTEIVQPKIDFGKEELPIGYNIKDNVIDSGKLESELREQVNAIRLNDIVILAENKFQSGSQNTGVTLGTFSKYEYSMGSIYVRLYTNGQYFRWYCNSPQKLTPGTYTKEFQVGDKTLYVTFKVIKPPTNDGSTTVVF